jgi:17beta-estradiol 17-dehydrogenase / very-long-chain 3-oxoacyl-CoA reductase
MSKIRKPSALTPLPSTYVRAVLSRIGLPCGALGSPYYTTPYWAHSLVDFVLRQVGLMGIYMRVTHGMHKDLRARALKKLAREAKSQ